jgi:hypothetical protein
VFALLALTMIVALGASAPDDPMEGFPTEITETSPMQEEDVPLAPSRADAAPSRGASTVDLFGPVEDCPPTGGPLLLGGPVVGESPRFPFVPYMLGDFIGPLGNPMTDLKVSEGDSPVPLDRVFYRFNAYSNLDPSRHQSPRSPYNRVNLFTNVFGFEKRVFGDLASIGVRVPINGIEARSRGAYLRPVPGPGDQTVLVPGVPDHNTFQLGNINTIFKVRLMEDRAAGNFVSAGAALSFPTATTASIDPGPSTAAVLQPFLGYLHTGERFYVQGFTAITMPLVTVQTMILFTDLGFGYWVYRDANPTAFLTGIAPTFEMHLNAPLQSPERFSTLLNATGFLPFYTQFNLTFGGTFEFRSKATLGLAFVLPTASPLPFDYEFLAHFNYRW